MGLPNPNNRVGLGDGDRLGREKIDEQLKARPNVVEAFMPEVFADPSDQQDDMVDVGRASSFFQQSGIASDADVEAAFRSFRRP